MSGSFSRQREKFDEKQEKGKTSTFNKIAIAPGVSLKEQKDNKREPRNEYDFVKTSGGIFRPQIKSYSTQRYAMSIEEY